MNVHKKDILYLYCYLGRISSSYWNKNKFLTCFSLIPVLLHHQVLNTKSSMVQSYKKRLWVILRADCFMMLSTS